MLCNLNVAFLRSMAASESARCRQSGSQGTGEVTGFARGSAAAETTLGGTGGRLRAPGGRKIVPAIGPTPVQRRPCRDRHDAVFVWRTDLACNASHASAGADDIVQIMGNIRRREVDAIGRCRSFNVLPHKCRWNRVWRVTQHGAGIPPPFHTGLNARACGHGLRCLQMPRFAIALEGEARLHGPNPPAGPGVGG